MVTLAVPEFHTDIRVRIPAGMSAAATEPKALSENNVLVWELGTLLSKQEKNLQMKLVAEAKYAEAADVLKKLANSKLDSEQQKSVDALGVQIKKALAADAAKSVGDLLKGNK